MRACFSGLHGTLLIIIIILNQIPSVIPCRGCAFQSGVLRSEGCKTEKRKREGTKRETFEKEVESIGGREISLMVLAHECEASASQI